VPHDPPARSVDRQRGGAGAFQHPPQRLGRVHLATHGANAAVGERLIGNPDADPGLAAKRDRRVGQPARGEIDRLPAGRVRGPRAVQREGGRKGEGDGFHGLLVSIHP